MTSQPNTDTAVRLSHFVDEKFRLLQSLLEKGELQLRLIESGDASGLLHLLAEKQTLINALTDAQDAIAAIQSSSEGQAMVWASPAARARCQAIAAECNAMGQQVLEIEAMCEKNATTQRDALSQQIHDFSNFNSRSSDSYAQDDETHLAEFDESS